MKNTIRYTLLLLAAALALSGSYFSSTRILADGSPIPWPKTPSDPKPTALADRAQRLTADGSPIPWPKTPGKPVVNA